MEVQQTSIPSQKRRWRLFPHPIRRLVIILSIILTIVLGSICIISVWQNWGAIYNITIAVLAVFALIIGLLTFWSGSDSGVVTPGSKPVVNSPQASLPDSDSSVMPAPESRSSKAVDGSSQVPVHDPADSPESSHSSQAQRNDGPIPDKSTLLNEMAALPPGTFRRLLSDLEIPTSDLSSYYAPQTIRAGEVLDFIGDEHLQRVREALDNVKKK